MTDILDDLRLQAQMQRDAADRAKRMSAPLMMQPAAECMRCNITADWLDDAAAEIERLRAELLELQQEESDMAVIAYMDGASAARKQARADALEEAACYIQTFAWSRPRPRFGYKAIERGRYEGEQAAASHLVTHIRALKEKQP